MIELVIDSWRKCSINNYYEIVDILEDKSLSQIDKDFEILGILTQKDADFIWQQKITDVKQLLSKAKFLNEFSYNKNTNVKNIKIADGKYTVDTNLMNFTAAQYIDFQTLWAKKDLRKYYGNILACFVIPKGKSYAEGYDVAELANKFRDEIDIVTANELVFFFLRTLVNLTKVFLAYSTLQMKKAKKKMNPEKYKILEAEYKTAQKDILLGLNSLI